MLMNPTEIESLRNEQRDALDLLHKINEELGLYRMMQFEEYQQKSWRYALDTSKNPLYLFTNLAGEVGELSSLVAKSVRDKHDIDMDKFVKEAGDVLWMLSAICTYYGVYLDDVATTNLKKLEERKQRNTISGSGDNR